MRARVALRAPAFHLAMRAGVAVRAAVFHLAMRAPLYTHHKPFAPLSRTPPALLSRHLEPVPRVVTASASERKSSAFESRIPGLLVSHRTTTRKPVDPTVDATVHSALRVAHSPAPRGSRRPGRAMADAEGETPTEVRASSSARANRPLSRVVPSDSTSPSAFGPIPRHRHRVGGRSDGSAIRFSRASSTTRPVAHEATSRAFRVYRGKRVSKDAF
jgi:hypothetical protein